MLYLIAAIALVLGIARFAIIGANEDAAVGDDRSGVRLGAELGGPGDIPAGLDVEHGAQAASGVVGVRDRLAVAVRDRREVADRVVGGRRRVAKDVGCRLDAVQRIVGGRFDPVITQRDAPTQPLEHFGEPHVALGQHSQRPAARVDRVDHSRAAASVREHCALRQRLVDMILYDEIIEGEKRPVRIIAGPDRADTMTIDELDRLERLAHGIVIDRAAAKIDEVVTVHHGHMPEITVTSPAVF